LLKFLGRLFEIPENIFLTLLTNNIPISERIIERATKMLILTVVDVLAPLNEWNSTIVESITIIVAAINIKINEIFLSKSIVKYLFIFSPRA
jgi:hypothetical protein